MSVGAGTQWMSVSDGTQLMSVGDGTQWIHVHILLGTEWMRGSICMSVHMDECR